MGGGKVLIVKVSSEDTNAIELVLYTSEGLVQDTNTNILDIILCFGKKGNSEFFFCPLVIDFINFLNKLPPEALVKKDSWC